MYNNKILLNRTIPLNFPPVLTGVNAKLQPDLSYLISILAFDNNKDNLTIGIYADNDNIGYDGIIISAITVAAPFDTKNYSISSDSFLFDTNYLYLIVSDGIDSNYYYFHTPLKKYKPEPKIDFELISIIVDWNALDTGIYSDSLRFIINDTSGLYLKIEVNGILLTDTQLSAGDTGFYQYFSWDSGYYDISITARNSSGTQQIENIRILRNADIEIFNTDYTDTFIFCADSSAVNILMTEAVDTNYIHIILNDSASYTGQANLILGTELNDTKIISITRVGNLIDSMVALMTGDYSVSAASLLRVNYGLAGDTTIFAAGSSNAIYIDLFFDIPSSEISNYRIFVYCPGFDSGYITNIKIENGHLKAVIPPAYNFYITIVKIKNNALQLLGDDIAVYPNPWKPNDGNISTGSYATGAYIRNLRKNDTIKIYSFSGELIFSHNFLRSDIDYYNWNCRINKNNYIPAGVYFLTVKRGDSGRNIIKKFMAIR